MKEKTWVKYIVFYIGPNDKDYLSNLTVTNDNAALLEFENFKRRLEVRDCRNIKLLKKTVIIQRLA